MVCHRFGEDVAYVPPAVREGGKRDIRTHDRYNIITHKKLTDLGSKYSIITAICQNILLLGICVPLFVFCSLKIQMIP